MTAVMEGGRLTTPRLIDLAVLSVNDSARGARQAGPRSHVDRRAQGAGRDPQGRDRPRRGAHAARRDPSLRGRRAVQEAMTAAAIQPLNTFACDNLLKSRSAALDCGVR